MERDNSIEKCHNDEEKVRVPFVTVGIITYNPDKEKLFKAIDSAVCQKNVRLQLVFSDDGSKENYFNDIEQYLKKRGITDYKFTANEINQGTVINCLNAVELADGEYVRFLSPGDYLFGEHALEKWIRTMEEENADWSFCDAYYYYLDENKEMQLIKCRTNPHVIEPYINKRQEEYRWNYLAVRDFVLGASTIYRKDILLKYLRKIKGTVIYAEDNILSLMMLDRCKVTYVPESFCLYEYGTGISTNRSSAWAEKLKKDYEQAMKIMIAKVKESDNKADKKIYKAFLINQTSNKWLRRIRIMLTPSFFCGVLKHKFCKKRFTPTTWPQEENK